MSETEGEQLNTRKWASLMEQVLDNVFGKDMSVTYEFRDFTIDLTNAEVSKGRKIGSGQWKINGNITINAVAHKGSSGQK